MDKYLKYKNKYLNLKNKVNLLKGGLIGRIPDSKLDEMKSDYEIIRFSFSQIGFGCPLCQC